MVHEVQDILSHGGVGVHVVVCTFPMVPCIQHPNVMGLGITLAQGLPVVGTAKKAVQDEKVRGLEVACAGQRPCVRNHVRGVKQARYCATALDMPRYNASATSACPMLTSAKCGTDSAKSRKF